MSPRVKWMIAGLLGFAAAGWGITIPVTVRSTGFSSTGTLLTTDASPDGNWTFYAGNNLSALSGSPVGAWVFTANKQPLNNGIWAPNDGSSVWISPTNQRKSGGHLEIVPGTSYIAVTTLTIPAMTNAQNWPQWWFVMSGVVWADDSVSGNSYYLLDSSNNIVYSGSLSGSPSPTSFAGFSFATWVDPGATYKLAFILPNTPDTWSGFRASIDAAYVTPEPGAWITMLTTGAGLAFFSWRRRRKKAPPVES